MKINNGTLAIVAASILTLIGIFATLIVTGHDPDRLIGFVVGGIIPTIVSYIGVTKADAAKKSAEQAVTNTNGNTTALIEALHQLGGQVPPGFESMDPQSPNYTGIPSPKPVNATAEEAGDATPITDKL